MHKRTEATVKGPDGKQVFVAKGSPQVMIVMIALLNDGAILSIAYDTRCPWEARGTSGMKVLVNGGLTFSELDGWWAEAYAPEVGWALGDGRKHGEDPAWDAAEAEAMHALLENEVVPDSTSGRSGGRPPQMVLR